MRSKNALKNLISYIIYTILVFALGLIFSRFIILTYGSEINGLTSTITRLLALINLIQAGAVGAAIFQMYKPVANNDFETQSAIIFSSRRFYKKMTVIYLILALVIGIFYGLYLHNENLSTIEIFLSFLIFASNGSFAFLVTAPVDIYASPHQKKYYLIIAAILEQLVRYLLITVVLVFKLHFLFMYVSIFVGGLVGAILNTLYYNKITNGQIKKVPLKKDLVIPNKKYLMLSSVGSQAVIASPSVIITTFIGLSYSSVFSIYFMIYTSIYTLLSSIQLSVSAIFGNLVSTSDDEKIHSVYDSVEYLTMTIGTIISVCTMLLFLPFISLYSQGITDIEYVVPLLAVFTVINICLFTINMSFSYVATIYGYFKYTCNVTLTTGFIGIVISTIGAILFGMPYVMVGLIFSQTGSIIATLYILKKRLNWFSIGKLFLRSLFMILMVGIAYIISINLNERIQSWVSWLLHGLSFVGISILVVIFYSLVFERKTFKALIFYITQLMNIKKKVSLS